MAQRIVIPQMSWVHGTGHAAKASDPISSNKGVHQGTMIGYKVIVGAAAAQAVSITLKDEDGDVIYTFADTPDQNTTTVRMGLLLPLYQQEVITIDPSADAGGAATLTVDVVLYYLPD